MEVQTRNVRAAVVQAASIPFESDACVEKAVRLTAEAAGKGAQVVVFPEAFIAWYPTGLRSTSSSGTASPTTRRRSSRA
jgi:nitrilase